MKVAVVQGGPSTEAQVSRKSGAAVCQALAAGGHEAVAFELDRTLPQSLLAYAPDVVFPALHGALGEDGCAQGMFEVLGFPYVGSDVRASAIAADKIASKLFFRTAGLPVAQDTTLGPSDLARPREEILAQLRREVGADFVLKPSEGGSTIGISRIFAGTPLEEFARAFDEAARLDAHVLVERYVKGHEVTCAVFEDEAGPRALPVILIHSDATEWYDFSSKYAPGGSRHVCPAPFSDALTLAIQCAAIAAHRVVGARDLSRSDFIIADGDEPILLEINTLPGMTEVSLYPDAAAAAGISFPELVDRFVRHAHARGVRAREEGRPLPTG